MLEISMQREHKIKNEKDKVGKNQDLERKYAARTTNSWLKKKGGAVIFKLNMYFGGE